MRVLSWSDFSVAPVVAQNKTATAAWTAKVDTETKTVEVYPAFPINVGKFFIQVNSLSSNHKGLSVSHVEPRFRRPELLDPESECDGVGASVYDFEWISCRHYSWTDFADRTEHADDSRF